jgi:hypothetical protein
MINPGRRRCSPGISGLSGSPSADPSKERLPLPSPSRPSSVSTSRWLHPGTPGSFYLRPGFSSRRRRRPVWPSAPSASATP